MTETPTIIIWREDREDENIPFLHGLVPSQWLPPFSFPGIEFGISLDSDQPLLTVATRPDEWKGEEYNGKVLFNVTCVSVEAAKEIAEFIAVRIVALFDELQMRFTPVRKGS